MNMTFDTSWDVEKYKYNYELDHQWKLKKAFLLAHKEKYPENRLICLAQTFINIHYLGCNYDKPIMELIESLSEGLAAKNEKWEKESFVAASHAVEERVASRLSGPYKPPVQNKFVNFQPQGTSKDDESQETGTKRKIELDEEGLAKKAKLDEASEKAKIDLQFVVDSGPFGKFVLFENAARTDGSISVIERTASASLVTPNYQFTKQNQEFSCKVSLDGLYLATGQGASQKASKESACSVAVQRLRETSFTVLVKTPYSGSDTVNKDLKKDVSIEAASLDKPIDDSNIGNKMLKLMGWSGGGLGKNEQGMEEPIKPNDCNVRRGGLGIRSFFDFKNKVGSLIKEFAHSDSKEDLVFSPEFSKDERKAIHELVGKYNLKSKSFGKEEDNRRIVVFKKIRPLEIVEDLLLCGGKTDKYELIPPESMKDKF